MIEFRLLGPLEVLSDGESVRLGGRRQRSVLAILLLNVGRVVSVDRLADDLYAGSAPATAVTQVHRHVSELRRLLPELRLETVAPGYVLRADREQLDLHRFEQLVSDGIDRLERGEFGRASALVREALALWRGPALADLEDAPFAAAAIGRLEELRLAARERALEAEIALGHAREAVPELEELAAADPLRERPVELLMLALYRAGRQADALAVYRSHRRLLADELGLEPGPGLRRLEAAILQQDPQLAPRGAEPLPVVIAVALARPHSRVLVDLLEGEGRETILLRLAEGEAELSAAALELEEQRSRLGASARGAAFVAAEWREDVARFARAHDAALVLVDAPSVELPAALLQASPADVGLVYRGGVRRDGAVHVAFGGGEHDWAALELAAAVARTQARQLRLVGTSATRSGRRDASRLLADAAIAVQRAFDVASAPMLAPATPDALVAVVEDAGLVVAGIGSGWRAGALDPVRAALVTAATPPVVLVHRGVRPGLLAPRESRTRFTWSLQY